MSVDLTAAQARAVAELAEREGSVVLHQLAPGERGAASGDVYATPHGSAAGYRVSVDGAVAAIGETLPAPE